MRSNTGERGGSGYALNRKLMKSNLLSMDAKKGTLSEKSFRTGAATASRQGSRAFSRGTKSIGRSEVSRFFKKSKN